jgi:hypothetical protein
MPPLAIAGVAAAAIGAGSTYLASKSNSKAIKRATAAQTDSTNQQIAYQREADQRNLGALSPFMQRGNAAGDTINAALGIGGGFMPQGAPEGGQTVQSPAQAASSAYEQFKQSTGYQSRFNEGMRGLNSGYAGAGVLQSGAAQRAALRYGQEFASGEFGNWMSMLGNQQQTGFAGASALAGVSQGSADRMGAISQNNANMAGQAAVARAQNTGALYTGLAGIAGQAAGALSSYQRPQAQTYAPALGVVPHYGYG